MAYETKPKNQRAARWERFRKRTIQNPSRSISVAAKMPRLLHASEPFDIKKSEVLKWLCDQPEILQTLFDYYRDRGAITYDKENGTWRGAEVS